MLKAVGYRYRIRGQANSVYLWFNTNTYALDRQGASALNIQEAMIGRRSGDVLSILRQPQRHASWCYYTKRNINLNTLSGQRAYKLYIEVLCVTTLQDVQQ